MLSCAVLLAASACDMARGGDRAAHDQPAPIDVARAATDPTELVRALVARHADATRGLGAHAVVTQATLRVHDVNAAAGTEPTGEPTGEPLESLDEAARLEVAAGGAFHASTTNSRDDGRDTFFHDGTLWLRPRSGKYHRREPASREEPARILDDAWGGFGAQVEVIAASIAVADRGAASVDGRAARRIALRLGTARARATEALPQRAWRDGLRVLALTGEVLLDAKTGVLLRGTLSARVAFERDGRSLELALGCKQELTGVGTAITITPPTDEDSVTTPGRSGEVAERARLLDGIAAPARGRR